MEAEDTETRNMSEKIPTTSRLDSLTKRSGTAASSAPKPSLKFKPKVVARRTKEERDADAPTNAPETKRNPHANRGGNRGRGGSSRGRGGRALANTHVVQVGPLASGSALNATSASAVSRGYSGSATPEFMTRVLKSEGGSRESTPGLESDEEDEDGVHKINMNDERYSNENEFFPVRAPRSAHINGDDIEAKSSSCSVTPEILNSKSSGNLSDDKLPTSVKDEPIETNLNTLLKQKDNALHQKLHELNLDVSNISSSADVETAEQEIEDQKAIVKKLLDTDNKDDKFLFLQLPRVLPEFKPASPETGSLENESSTDQASIKVKDEKNGKGQIPELEGTIGKLRVHKSGKVTMKIGNVVLDVGRGSHTTFLQDIIITERTEETNASYLLGHIEDKLVATPRFL